MGENFDISHLTLSEQKCILQVLQRNEDLQRNYNQRITRMRAELQWLKKRGALKPTGNTNISSSSSNISSSSGTTLIDPTKTCNRCRTQLGRIINRGAPCRLCQLKVCKSCRFYIDGAATQWICVVCNKHREIEAASGGWMNYFGRSRSTERAFTTSVDDSTRVAQRQANYRNWRERVSTSAPATQSESHESVMVTRTQLSPVSRSPSHGSQLQQSPRRSGLPSVLPDPSVIERIPSPSSPRSVSPLSRDYLSSAVQRTPSLSPLTVSPTYKIRSRDTSPLSLSRSPQGTPTHPPPPPLIQTRSPSPAPRSPASRSRSHSSEGPHSPSPLAKKTSFGFETSAINNATSMSSKSDHGRHKSSSSGAKVFLFPSSKDQRLLMELIEGKTQKNLSVPKSGRDESDSGSSSAATSPSTSNLRLADYSPTPMSPKTPSSPRTPLSPSLLPYESQENSQQSRSASNYSMYSCNDLSVDGPKSPIPPPRRRASPLRKQKAVTEAPPTLPHYPRSDSSGKESIWPPDRSVRKLSNVSDSGFAESIGTCSAPLSPRSRQQSRQSSKSSSYNAQSKSPTPRTSVQSMGTMDSMSSLSEFENEKPPPPPPLVVFRKVTLKKKNKPPEPPTSPKIIQDDVFGVGRIEATGSIPFVPKIGGAQSLPRLNTNNYSVPFSDTNVNLELTSSLSTLTPNTAKFSTSVNNSENNNQRKRKRLALTRYLGALTNSVLSQSASLPSLLPNHGSYDLSKFTPPIEELLEPVRMLNKRPVLTEDGVGSPSSSVDVEPMTKLASLKKRFKVRFRKKGPAPKPPTPVLCDDVSECSRFAIDEDQLSLKSNLQVSMVAIHSQGSVDPFDRFGPIPQDEDLNSVQNDDLRSVGGFETPTFSDGSLNIDSLSLDTQSEININFGKMMPESDDYRLVFISSSGSSKSSGLDQLADSTEQNIDQILETPSYNRISTTLRRCEIGDGSIFWEDSDWEFHSDIDDYEPCGSDLELVPFVGKSTSLVHIPGQFQHEEVPPPSTIGFDPEDKRSLSPLINRLSVNDGVEQQNSAINCCEECQKDQLESSPSPCDDVLEEKSNPENICEEERQFRTLSVGDSSFQGERIVNISCKTGYDVLSHVVAEGHNQEEEGANFTEINRSVIESEQSPLGILSYESADFSGDFRANESSNRVLDGVNKEAVHLGTIGSKEDDYDLDILEFLRALFEETSDDEDVTSAEVVDPQPIRYARVDENGIVMCELSREDEEMSENENLDSERHFDDDRRTMEGNSSEPTSSKYPTTDGEDEPTDEDLQTIDVGCSDVEDEAPSSILEEYFTFALESDSSGSQLDSGRSTKQPAVKLKKSSVEEPIAVVNDPTDGEDCDAYDSSSEEDVEQPYSSFYGHQDHYLHTIVEESCEESDKSGSPSPRTESPETSELEKYFSFAISGLEEDKGGGGSNRPLSFLSECSDCSSQFSTASSVYGDDDLQNDRTSSDLASSRLENYFMSGLVASKLGVNSYPDDVEFMTTDDSEYLTSDGEDVFFANSRRNSGSFFSSVENFDFFKIHSPVSLKSDSSDDSDISQTDAPFDRSDGFDTVKRKKKSRKIQNTLPPEVNFDELRQVVALDTIFSSYDVQKPKRSISGQHNGKLQNFSTDVKDVVNYLLDATCSSFVKSLPIEDISTDSQLVLISASPELAKENNLTVVTDLLDDLIDKICNDNDVYQTPIPDLPCNDVIYSDFANKLASNVLTTVFEGLQKMNFLKFLSSYCDNTINKFLFAEVEKIKMFDNFANELSVDLIDQAFHDVRHLESFSSDIAKSIMNSSLDVENFRNSRIENNVTMKCPAKSNEISKLPVNSVIVELDDQSVVISELLSEICGKVCEMEQEESNIATKERKSSTNSEDEAIFIFNKVLSHINGMSASSKGQSQDSSQLNFLESQIKQLMETVSPFASVAGSVTSEEVSSCTSSTLETSSFSSEYGSDTDTLESSDVEECATPECVTPTPTEALPDAEPSKCSFEAMEIYQQVLSSLSKIRAGIPENKEEVRPCEKDNGDSFSKDYISNQIKMLMMSVNSSNASSPSSTPEMKHIGIVSHSSHCSELDSDLVAGMRIRKGPRSVDSRSSQDTRAETCSETCSIVSTSSISFEVEDSEGTTESDDPKPSECDVILSIIDDLAKEGKDVLAGDSNEQGFLPYYSENGHNFQELGSSSVMQGLGAFRGTHNRPDMYIPKSRSKESFDAIMQVKSSLEIQKSSESLSDIPEESENSQSDDDEGDCVKRLSVILVDDGSNKVRESIRDSTTSLSSKDSRNTRDSSTSLSSSKESFVTVISPSDPPPTRRYLSKSDSHSYPALPVSRKYTYDHDLHKYYATKSHSTFQIDSEGSMKPRRRARKTGAVKQALADLISPHHHKKYSTQMWVESIQTRHKDIANDGTNPGLAKMLNSKEKASSENNLLAAIPSDSSPVIATKSTGHIPDLTLGKQGFRDTGYYSLKSSGESIPSIGVSSSSASSMSDHISSSRTQEVSMALSMQNIPESHNSRTNTLPPQRTALSCAESFSSPNIPSDVYSSSSSKSTTLPIKSRLSKYGPPNARSSYRAFLSAVGLVGRLKSSLFRSQRVDNSLGMGCRHHSISKKIQRQISDSDGEEIVGKVDDNDDRFMRKSIVQSNGLENDVNPRDYGSLREKSRPEVTDPIVSNQTGIVRNAREWHRETSKHSRNNELKLNSERKQSTSSFEYQKGHQERSANQKQVSSEPRVHDLDPGKETSGISLEQYRAARSNSQSISVDRCQSLKCDRVVRVENRRKQSANPDLCSDMSRVDSQNNTIKIAKVDGRQSLPMDTNVANNSPDHFNQNNGVNSCEQNFNLRRHQSMKHNRPSRDVPGRKQSAAPDLCSDLSKFSKSDRFRGPQVGSLQNISEIGREPRKPLGTSVQQCNLDKSMTRDVGDPRFGSLQNIVDMKVEQSYKNSSPPFPVLNKPNVKDERMYGSLQNLDKSNEQYHSRSSIHSLPGKQSFAECSPLAKKDDNSKSSSKPAISSLAAQENNSSEGSVPQINVSEYTERSLSNANPEEDVEQAFTAYRHRSRTSLSSFGARSESMTSVYSAAGGGRYGTVTVTGEILFKLSYNYKAGTMEIHIMECRDLAPVDIKRNRSDPYVKVYLLPDKTKGGKRKTKVKKHTLNPQFDEVLKFHVTISELETRTLWLTVWHSDMFGRNDFLGEVMMSLGYEIFDKQDPKWYALQERIESLESPLTYKGDIIVAIKFIPPDLSSSKRSKRCDLNNPKGELHVLVKEARNLMATRANGTSDPFCKSYLLPEKSKSFKQKTPVIKKNCNPAWNYTFVYESTLEELKGRCLELTIWDYDKITSNDFLGGVRLSLGTGKYHDRNVDWMDSQNEEVRIWQDMLDHPNQWTDGSLLLRPSMQKQL